MQTKTPSKKNPSKKMLGKKAPAKKILAQKTNEAESSKLSEADNEKQEKFTQESSAKTSGSLKTTSKNPKKTTTKPAVKNVVKLVKKSLVKSSMQYCSLLPLRDIVVFPRMIVPLSVGRERSVRALEQARKQDGNILLATQKDAWIDLPQSKHLFEVGVFSTILQMLHLPDGTVKVLVEGKSRAQLQLVPEDELFLKVAYQKINDADENNELLPALRKATMTQFDRYCQNNHRIPDDIMRSLNNMANHGQVIDLIAQHLHIDLDKKQKLLATNSITKRFEGVLKILEDEIGMLRVESKIRSRVKKQVEKSQREYYLNEQIKAIQKELGDGDKGGDEISELERKIRSLRLTKEAREKATSEIKKLKQMSPLSAEATVVRNYLDWIVSLPWKKRSKINSDMEACKKILNEDHYGLDEVKERILDYLAVQSRVKIFKGPILCLVGPPGVGKTSLGKSIARAIGRAFVRVSLGGIRDEAEIRGHRRTYVGAMPGKIIQSMKKAKVSDPFFLLDEVDKIGNDWRGDPTSALLEVLDPEQNNTFNDHYLEVDYDLSECMFITTANSLNMPQALIDRMEVVRLPGYTENEKIEIAKRHLVPKIFEQSGVEDGEIFIKEDAIRDTIRYHTREAGARNLERAIARIARKSIRKITANEKIPINIKSKNLQEFLGIRKFRFGEVESKDLIGVATGLAWTEVGGELLTIEAVTIPGKGRIRKTGKLGDTMQESIHAAENFIKSRSWNFGITPDVFEKIDLHVHVPEGATPKDGPSAGIAIATALVSVLTGIAADRTVAMTGEITLRGRVLPIGGLKEKLLAALRGNIKTVIIPDENKKDLEEIPDNVKNGLKIIPVDSVEQVLHIALKNKLTPLPSPIEIQSHEKTKITQTVSDDLNLEKTTHIAKKQPMQEQIPH